MTLYLSEFTGGEPGGAWATALVAQLDEAFGGGRADLLDVQVTSDRRRVFAVAEAERAEDVTRALGAVAQAPTEAPVPVRLVGADVATLRGSRGSAGYLVEWDLPAGLDMDTYLARKAAKSPLYAQVPEVSFLRTYVREDMEKCLCLYDAPDPEAVRRARDAVSTPIDRLHPLAVHDAAAR